MTAIEEAKEKGKRLTKNEKKRLKEKLKKQNNNNTNEVKTVTANSVSLSDNLNIEIEYVAPDLQRELSLSTTDSSFSEQSLEEFKQIFDKFEKLNNKISESTSLAPLTVAAQNTPYDPLAVPDAGENTTGLSKKKTKLLNRLTVPQLKLLVNRSDVVEAHDVSADDPKFLVYLKACRNAVPVPRHWCQKRRYLDGKRGIEKPPFRLPDFIAETGITKIRDALLEIENKKNANSRARERMRPKMGKMDIDYQVLHDAFFKYQTKPKVTGHGELYYEGKEFEATAGKNYKPGSIGAELASALGMTENSPPPWLLNMQRYGPPPSYPSLKIPGLTAPLPPGAVYGYQLGGWGKPPVDELGRPLYGDVFGILNAANDSAAVKVDVNYRFGAITVVEEEEEEEEEYNDEEVDDTAITYVSSEEVRAGIETPAVSAEFDTLSGPIDLRKREDAAPARELYQVLSEKNTSSSGDNGQIFSTDRVYQLPGSEDQEQAADGTITEQSEKGKRKRKDAVNAAAKKAKEFKF